MKFAFTIYFFCTGEMVCELPNNRLEKFQGNLLWDDHKLAVDNNNIALRVSKKHPYYFVLFSVAFLFIFQTNNQVTQTYIQCVNIQVF